MKKVKQEKGITLIALVVTIIVLLILAGVTIALVLGQDGIFSKAETAAENTTNSQELEQLKLAAMEARTYNLVDKADFGEKLTESIHKVYPEATITPDGNNYKVGNMPSGNTYLIDGVGKVIIQGEEEPTTAKKLVDMYLAGESCTDENCTNPDHLHIGDYVNYQPVVGNSTTSYADKNGISNQTFTVPSAEQEKINWRVLGISGDHVLLTSGIAVQSPLNIKAAHLYVYGEEELHNICSIYGTGAGAESARSITIEDINTVCGVVQEGNGVYLKEDLERSNNIEQMKLLGKSHTLEAGTPTPETVVLGTEITEETVKPMTAYGYGEFSLTVNNRIKDMIFKGTTDKCPYIIASNGFGEDFNGAAGWGPGLVYQQAVGKGLLVNLFYVTKGTDGWNINNGDFGVFGIRPVVELQANVTTDTIQKIEDQPENW